MKIAVLFLSYEAPAASLIFATPPNTMAQDSGESATADVPRAEDYIQTASQCYGACIVSVFISRLDIFEVQHLAHHSSPCLGAHLPSFMTFHVPTEQCRERLPSIMPKASSFGANRLWNAAPISMASRRRWQQPRPPAVVGVLVRRAEAERYGSAGTVTLDPT